MGDQVIPTSHEAGRSRIGVDRWRTNHWLIETKHSPISGEETNKSKVPWKVVRDWNLGIRRRPLAGKGVRRDLGFEKRGTGKGSLENCSRLTIWGLGGDQHPTKEDQCSAKNTTGEVR